jgi:Flp pilus assembly protein TadG
VIARLRALSADRCGATAVETALLMPLFLLLLLGAMELGRMAWAQAGLNYAVEEVARCASVTPTACGTLEQIQTVGAQRMGGAGLVTPVFAFNAAAPCGKQVTATAAAGFLVYRIFPNAPQIAASVCRP